MRKSSHNQLLSSLERNHMFSSTDTFRQPHKPHAMAPAASRNPKLSQTRHLQQTSSVGQAGASENSGGLMSINHQCIWRKLYEDEVSKRAAAEKQVEALKERIEKLEQQQKEYEKLIKKSSKISSLNQITPIVLRQSKEGKADTETDEGFNFELDDDDHITKAPIKKAISVFENARVHKTQKTNALMPQMSSHSNILITQPSSQITRNKVSSDLYTSKNSQPFSTFQGSAECKNIFGPQPTKVNPQQDTSQIQILNRPSSLSKNSQTRSSRMSLCQAPLIPSNQRKRVDYKKNEPFKDTRNSSLLLNRNSISSARMMTQQNFYPASYNPESLLDYNMTVSSQRPSLETILPLEPPKQLPAQQQSNSQWMQKQIETLFNDKQRNFQFSKLRIFAFDGKGNAEKLKLNDDHIRNAQKMLLQKNKRQKQTAQSMNFNNQLFLSFQQQQYVLPSEIKNIETSNLWPRQKLAHTQSMDEGFDKFRFKAPSFLDQNNEEDVVDDQDYVSQAIIKDNFTLGIHKRQLQSYGGNINDIDFAANNLATPINKRDAERLSRLGDNKKQDLKLEDEFQIHTHRILDYDQPTEKVLINKIDQSEFQETFNQILEEEKELVLETPINRAQHGAKQFKEWDEDDKEFHTFRQQQKEQYSDEQIREMQKSIRNISTNKKSSRLRRHYLAAKRNNEQSLVEMLKQANYGRVIENLKLNLPETKEESTSQNNSDDEQQNYMTESQFTFRNRHQRSESQNIWQDYRFGSRQEYSRITHASKHQMASGMPVPPSRTGSTMMGFYKNQAIFKTNPIMQSMPVLDFKSIKEATHDTSHLFGFPNSESFYQLQEQHSRERAHQTTSVLEERPPQQLQSPSLHPFNGYKEGTQISSKELVETPPRDPNLSSLFDEFFIIGVDRQQAQSLTWKDTDRHFLVPQTLYLNKQQDDTRCERRRVVKDFCFPDGVEISLIKRQDTPIERVSIKDQIQKILYSTENLKEQSFVFTLNSQDEKRPSLNGVNSDDVLETFPGQSQQDAYLNCLCVIVNDFEGTFSLKDIEGKSYSEIRSYLQKVTIYQTRKAYCFMFSNNYYQLQYDIIKALLNIQKLERLNVLERLLYLEVQFVLSNQDLLEILSYSLPSSVTAQMSDVLKNYGKIQPDSETQQVSIETNSLIGKISYELPMGLEQTFAESLWFCPQLFQIFSLNSFTQLMTAVLLERSIVFVGKQSLLSSVILGLNSLLHPFKWCLALVPILPHPLIEMIEAPLPLLVGITNREYRDLVLSQEERDSKIWVFLETRQIVWPSEDQNLPLLDFTFGSNNTLAREYQAYQDASKQIQEEGSTTVREMKSLLSSRNTENLSSSFFQTESIKQSCLSICKIVRRQIKTRILDLLKIPSSKTRITLDNLVEEMAACLTQHSQQADAQFMKQFVQTQMFTTYLEENVDIISQFHIVQ